ncbi:hypothetical protein CHGG_06992 [Chaetomium globosum CBS 148.51]|uniref:G-patch domain-containing protein n=1 Tax=Chaetomium globosum (strain ATCC 6205 / CBS 148.51 / DSM 1962 / NBRC 6347 / NRRL 1970) TaxID=306901 RepID=Q2GYG2_CHAGB|nr:uncharacterized protein CHGG_06992 [Chaetomium globosum CBS 148.51]EAQ85739.1 hypothetical protein CHGG_06992 [Chaetomium globosum CBS 148.51]
MAAPPPQPPSRGGMSLYANLLDTDGSASIARDPVLFKNEQDHAPAKKAIDPAPASAPAPNRSTLADWAATEDDEYEYGYGGPAGGGDKRQRGGRRKKKKNRNNNNNEDAARRETDWDELYDPARPTNVEEYLRSEDRVREVREWKAVLYAHRRRGRHGGGGGRGMGVNGITDQFAPPASFTLCARHRCHLPVWRTMPPGERIAYARRFSIIRHGTTHHPLPPKPHHQHPHRHHPQQTQTPATISRAPVRYSQPANPDADTAMDIDAADTDYDPEVDYTSIPLPPQQPPTTTQHSEEERTTRPGQKGFAQRLMAKYGWTKGSGLGAAQTGITTALRVQVEKRKRRPDAEGGGFVGPAGGRGRIIAPNVKGNQGEEDGGVGKMSVVVVLDRMLDGMADVEGEVEAGLGQEIGEECGERYGRVERIVVDVEGARVFIRFVEAVSALKGCERATGEDIQRECDCGKVLRRGKVRGGGWTHNTERRGTKLNV